MRENMGLYRGKRKDNGEWVKGDLRHWRNGEVGIHDDKIGRTWKVDPDTVGECSGKKFKDKMCFEGDIIFARYSRLMVGWDSDFSAWWTYYLDDRGNPRRFCPLCDIAHWETDGVIGNIHDNPELLKVTPSC